MYRKSFAEINLDSLKQNFLWLKNEFSSSPFLCPMVKANAYGHGDIVVAKTIEELGVESLGVCLIEEGIHLRKNDVHTDILVFRGFDQTGAFAIYEHGLTPVVATWNQLEHLLKVSKRFQQIISLHLKFDTGMNRLGFRLDEAEKLSQFFKDHPELDLKAILTHLYCGEDALQPDGSSAEQLRGLAKIAQHFKTYSLFFHALNSSGLAGLYKLKQNSSMVAKNPEHPLLMMNWGLRPGLALYGYCEELRSENSPISPVMSLKSRVGAFRNLKAGETVSYGATWTAKRPTQLAIVPLGYADGYHRLLSNLGEALFFDHRVPIVGKVCMDYLMLDVTDVFQKLNLNENSEKVFEEEVILFGSSMGKEFLGADELAKKAQTISWEILTSVSERIPRVYSGQMSRFVKNEVFL